MNTEKIRWACSKDAHGLYIYPEGLPEGDRAYMMLRPIGVTHIRTGNQILNVVSVSGRGMTAEVHVRDPIGKERWGIVRADFEGGAIRTARVRADITIEGRITDRHSREWAYAADLSGGSRDTARMRYGDTVSVCVEFAEDEHEVTVRKVGGALEKVATLKVRRVSAKEEPTDPFDTAEWAAARARELFELLPKARAGGEEEAFLQKAITTARQAAPGLRIGLISMTVHMEPIDESTAPTSGLDRASFDFIYTAEDKEKDHE